MKRAASSDAAMNTATAVSPLPPQTLSAGSAKRFNIPTILVVLGATGDLMRKKIIPALYHLYRSGALPEKFQVIAYSRRDLTDALYHQTVRQSLESYYRGELAVENLDQFLALFSYQQGQFEELADYHALGERLGRLDKQWRICTNKLFYLSVPPAHYQVIFQHLKESGLTDPCGPEEGWTRVLVEKPFGDDLTTARQLDIKLAELFKEEQIYRIDHYLAKEMLQNILAFRFSNNLYEQSWSNQFIERIEIRLLEKLGVEDRGSFYDKVGALRDVGQNHLLQMLALITMEHPQSLDATAIRARRAEALDHLGIMSPADVASKTFRAQYEGYKHISGVEPDSTTETYFRLETAIDSPRWRGVPITLEAGKRLGEAVKEIVITFKHPMPCLCPPDSGHHYQNRIIMQLEPKEGIWVHFWAKKPGFSLDMEERTFDFVLHGQSERSQYVAEYAKLLVDAIAGDQTLFVSTEEITRMWAAIDPIVQEWKKGSVPLAVYRPDEAAIVEQAKAALASRGSAGQPSNGQREIGLVGLGKMGGNAAIRLGERGWRVVGYNRSPDDTDRLAAESGLVPAYSLAELVNQLVAPRTVWLMLPAGEAIDEAIFGHDGLAELLSAGDTIIEAGNSYYDDDRRRAAKLAASGIKYIDVGFSGGPGGARNGACLMIGGDEANYRAHQALFTDLARPDGHRFFAGVGAGHFAKMVHNGIEYGMMQAIAEGFAVLRASDYQFDLTEVAAIYNRGSVIESRLVGWLSEALAKYGQDLAAVSGTVKHTGEGLWTVETARQLGVPVPIIEGALEFRRQSEANPSYTGQILSALRNAFGGHAAAKD